LSCVGNGFADCEDVGLTDIIEMRKTFASRWLRPGLCLALGLLAGGALSEQQQPPPQQPEETGGEVVVQGRRPTRILKGGAWKISLSRYYTFSNAITTGGDMLARAYGSTAPPASRTSVAGAARTWNTCLKDVDLEPFLRLLVGEGATSVGTMVCSKLNVEIGAGRVNARQTCGGGTETQVDPTTQMTSTVTMTNQLSVKGKYDSERLAIDFDDRQMWVGTVSSSTVRRWWIDGKRVGACETPAPKDTPAERDTTTP
jgi:hypothetical protein